MLLYRPLLSATLSLAFGALFGGMFKTAYHAEHIGSLIKLQETSSAYKCVGDTRVNLLCSYQHVLYWNQTVYYIITDGQDRPPIPDIAVPRTLEFAVPVKVITHTELVKVLQEGGPVTTTMDTAVLWHRINPSELYHALWENVANVHMVVCKVLGKCSYDPHDDLQIIFVDRQVHYNTTNPVKELWQCLSRRPLEEMGSTRFSAPVLIRKLAIGIGLEMEGKPSTVGDRYPPSNVMRGSWTSRMRTCLELPPLTNVSSIRQRRATVLMRDSTPGGWVVQNPAELMDMLRSKLPGYIVEAVDLSNSTIKQQAMVLSGTTLFFSAHSSLITHAFWMPTNAVFLELDHFGLQGDAFYQRYLFVPMSAFHYVHHIRVVPTNPKTLQPRPELYADRDFESLITSERTAWLRSPSCSYRWLSRRMAGVCRNWVHRMCDPIVQLDRLAASVDQALQWLNQHGVSMPVMPRQVPVQMTTRQVPLKTV